MIPTNMRAVAQIANDTVDAPVSASFFTLMLGLTVLPSDFVTIFCVLISLLDFTTGLSQVSLWAGLPLPTLPTPLLSSHS